MSTTEAQKRARYKYEKDHIKRVPLDMKIEVYVEIKNAADAAGEPVNTYIKKAIAMRMEADKK